MKNRVRSNDTRAARPTRLAAAAVAIAAAVAGGGIAAGPADAAASHSTGKASYRHHQARFEHPRREHRTLRINGTRGSDRIALRLKAGRPDILQVDVGDDGSPDFSFKSKHIAKIVVDARAGDDSVRIDDANGAFTDTIATTIDGGDGNDTLAGGAGAEKLLGGAGNDSIDGNGGNDLALMGAGDDTFVWDPGDGSDTVQGEAGSDTLRFNGAAIAEHIDLSANGNRLRFFRDIANITMDTDDVETVDFNALGGADTITVNDLSATDVRNVNADLAGTLGGSAGDGQADSVIVNGTNRNDTIAISGDASGVAVSGLPTLVAIQHQEPTDQLAVNGLGGDDAITATALAAQSIALTIDGGDGNDTLAGGAGAEKLLGGAGNDSIDGNGGNDLALMGAGDDTFVWDPGDGSDTVQGEAGSDTLRFNGAAIAEHIDLSANGNRLRFFRDIANITMDTDDVETVDFNALGGADTITVNDLSATDVTQRQPDLAGTLGGSAGDGQADSVIVNGTNRNDTISAAATQRRVSVSGLAATVSVTNAEAANDTLAINALDGDDVVNGSALHAGRDQAHHRRRRRGRRADRGAGNDSLFGRDGNDDLIGGPGLDVLDGGPGDNIADPGLTVSTPTRRHPGLVGPGAGAVWLFPGVAVRADRTRRAVVRRRSCRDRVRGGRKRRLAAHRTRARRTGRRTSRTRPAPGSRETALGSVRCSATCARRRAGCIRTHRARQPPCTRRV